MFAFGGMVILVFDPGPALVGREIVSQMRVKEESGLAEHLEHRASKIGAQATDPVIESDNDVSARLHQRGDREKGCPGVVGMMEHPVGYDDIHAGRPNAWTEKIHLKELDVSYFVIAGEFLPETKRGPGHVRRIDTAHSGGR